MHDYLFSIEVVRFAFVTGIVVSIVMYERRHVTTGSIVVPGYMAIFMIQPLTILVTFANAFVSYWIVNKVLAERFLLYGRAKFAILVVISAGIQALTLEFSPAGRWLWEADVPLLVGAGYVVPALIAHDMARQGRWKTVKAVVVSGLIVAVPLAIAVFAGVPGTNDLVPLVGYGVLAIDPGWVPMAVVLSVATAWGLLRNHRMRSGGFVGAAYIGMLGAQPQQALYLIGVGAVTYLVVTRTLMPWMILFGRRKFATMLLVSSVLSWSGLVIGSFFFGIEVSHYMTLGSVALMPLFVPGLIANDMERAGPVRTLAGIGVGASFVVPATAVGQIVMTTGTVPVFTLMLAVLAGTTVFSGQVRAVGRWVGRRLGIIGTEEVRPTIPEPIVPERAERPAPAPGSVPAPGSGPAPTPVVDPAEELVRMRVA